MESIQPLEGGQIPAREENATPPAAAPAGEPAAEAPHAKPVRDLSEQEVPIEDIPAEDERPGGETISAISHRKGDKVKCPRGKMHCYNWLGDIPGGYADSEMVEVQFKNTRKGYYKNPTHLPLKIGDMVAVEAMPGHDIGKVSLVGELVEMQMRKANIRPGTEFKRVFRLAKPADLEKYEEACAKETDTMIRARKIAESLHLNMKIGDVEYQGDGNRAIFYYIADERVDFRQLIKVLAETFKVRIEMKQIGARQEAGRIGGIGPCGRPLCCSSWMSNFVTVATSAARFQDISLNPQKLAGQCAKLKCCLNFEVDTYVESLKKLPTKDTRLETLDNTYFHFKTDIFKREITYSTDKSIAANLVTISAERAFEIISLNQQGIKPESLNPQADQSQAEKRTSHDILDADLTRFDKKKKKKQKPRRPDAQPKAEGEGAGNAAEKPRRNADGKQEGRQGRRDARGDRQPRQPRADRPEGAQQPAEGADQSRQQNRRPKKQRQWNKGNPQPDAERQAPKPDQGQ